MAKAKPLPSRQELQEAFTYVPKTGLLYRNSTGEVTGTKGNLKIQISHKGHILAVHRVAWKMVTGKDPVDTIDHINRDPYDNRWVNLREATRTQQQANRVMPSKHLTGVSPRSNKWQARIKKDGKQTYLGSFDTEMEAHLAYCFHAEQLHGEFACLD